jgi:membrane-bound serine protease (ClpP class)
MVLAFAGLTVWSRGAEPNEPIAQVRSAKAAVIVCKGLIDDGLFKSIKRRTRLALDDGVEYLIYEIGTYGGLLDAADSISKYLILDVGKKAHTVAYITTEAISAGAMISVSCQDIIMRNNTTIGDCAPIAMGAKLEGVEREKAESFTRAAFIRAAEANGYPAALLKAMVTMQTKVYRVRNLEKSRQQDRDVFEFFEGDDLPTDANQYDLNTKELIDSEDELLTLTASKAHEYGVARATVENLQGALDFLARRDNVVFDGEPAVLKTNWSEELVRWLNSPAVVAVLVMLAMLGVYIELSTPGVGLPGLVALVCFATVVGSKYLVGMANWVEVLLLLAGIVLLLVEIFVLPGFGVAGILGIVCIFGGLFGMLVRNPPDQLPWPQSSFDWQVFTEGVLGLSLGFVGFLAAAVLLTKHLPKLRPLSGLRLVAPTGGPMSASTISMTQPPQSRTELRVGDVGQVVAILRPAGKARFGDAIVDVVAQGDFIDNGAKVRIIEMHGNRVVVRAEEA